MDKLRIIIGDDSFANEDCCYDAMICMFDSMTKAAGCSEAFSLPIVTKEGLYLGKNIVPYASEVEIKTVSSVDELISEARRGHYDLVVTDLDYCDFGESQGGERVIDALQGSQTLALCTSSLPRGSDLGSKVDILSAPSITEAAIKWDDLGRKISQYYMTKDKK